MASRKEATELFFHLALCMTCLAVLAPVASADVHPTSGAYYETHIDLEVKVLGGYVRAKRSWYQGEWHFNRVWNRLEFKYDSYDGSLLSITRNGDVFDPANGQKDLFVFGKRRSIVVTDIGYRWQDRRGNWIEYDKNGKLTSYGDRNNVTVTISYDPATGRRTGVSDHHGNQVLWYEYDGNELASVRDHIGRRVHYRFTEKGLTNVTDVLGHEWGYDYDSNGRLIKRIDPENHIKHIAYDTLGRTKSIKDEQGIGQTIQYSYDRSARELYIRVETSGGRVEEAWIAETGIPKRYAIAGQTIVSVDANGARQTVTDRNGNQTVYEYDQWNNRVGSTDPFGYTTWSMYDPVFSNLLRFTDARGVVTAYSYDDRGNLTLLTEAAGSSRERTTLYDYDEFGNLQKMELPSDENTSPVEWTFDYDDRGNVRQITDPEKNSVSFKFDVMGNVVELTDERGKVWTFTYDHMGQLRREADPLGHSVHYEYDKVGNLAVIIDAEGHSTSQRFDANKRLISFTDAFEHSEQYEYSSDGLLVRAIDAEGITSSFEYLTDGRLSQVSAANNENMQLTYGDAAASGGASSSVTLRFGRYTQGWEYDARNFVSSVSFLTKDGRRRRTMRHDEVGNLVSEVDWDGRTNSYEFDEFNNLIKAKDALGAETKIEYDARDNLTAITDGRGHTTRFKYDKNDRLFETTRPLGQSTRYSYDAVGNLEQVLDAKGNKTSYEYDDAGLLDSVHNYVAKDHDTASESVVFGYDKRGNLTSWDDGQMSGTFAYDAANRLVKAKVDYGPFTLAYEYTYYKNGLTKSFTGPDGVKYEYSYSGNNRLSQVRIPELGVISINDYESGRPTNVLLPGGVAREFTYSELLSCQNIIANDAAGHTLVDISYTFTPSGQVRTKAVGEDALTYSYDDSFRLVGVNHSSGAAETFTLDQVGNIAATSDNADWTYNDNNELEQCGDTHYKYDGNGNLIHQTSEGEDRWFFYDIANRLVRVETGDGDVIARYGYSPFGRRLWKEVKGIRTYFLYAAEGLVGEFDDTGNQLVAYGYRPDSIFGFDPFYQRRNGQYFFYHNDHLGTPQIVTSVYGEVVWAAGYTGYGKATVNEGSTLVNNLRFAGQYFDDETGLHYNLARFYDPTIGRYTSADPLGIAGGLNLYAYAASDPIHYIDPYGESVHILVIAEVFVDALFTGASLGRWLFDPNCPNTADLAAHIAAVVRPGVPAPGLGKVAKGILGRLRSGGIQSALAKAGRRFKDALRGLRSKAPKNEVFRALRKGENPTKGLRARSPGANTEVGSHVMGKKQSDLISTTRDQTKAEGLFNSGHGVVAIDLKKVRAPVIDASQGVGKGRVFSRTKSHQEVLIRDSGGANPPIPPDAIRIIQRGSQ